jgi:hypothetical protein
MRSNRVLFFLVFTLLVAEGRALAYTDPGSGAMLWQLLLATILSAVFTVRYFFQRIKSKVSRVKSVAENNNVKSGMHDDQTGPR